MKNNETLLKFLKDNVGRDFTTYDALGCADTVNNILDEVLGYNAGGGPSTHSMYKSLQTDTRFEQQTTASARAGDIILSPTGYGNGTLTNGHVGFLGENGIIYSNNSNTSKLDTAFTAKKWKAYYKDKGGFPVVYYRAIAPSKITPTIPVQTPPVVPKLPVAETLEPTVIPTRYSTKADSLNAKTMQSNTSKLVFVLIAISLCVGFFLNKVTNEQFMAMAMLVFGFYYANKQTVDDKNSK